MHFIDPNLEKYTAAALEKGEKPNFTMMTVERRTFKSISVQQASEAEVRDCQIA